jgi:hypothetical protein
MRSQQILPIELRGKATKEQLLGALEAAEKELKGYRESPIARLYVSMRDNLSVISEDIDTLIKENRKNKATVLNSEDKVFERINNFWKLSGDFADTLEKLLSKTTPEDIREAEKTITSTQSIVSLIQNKDKLGNGK